VPRSLRCVPVSALVVALVALGPAAPGLAVTFTVTKTNDSADGTCDADCSLREAVIAANAAAGADTVVLPAGFYDLTITDAVAGVDENAAQTGDLDIAGGGFTLEGAGSTVTEIDARELGNRILHVQRNFDTTPIAIRGVALEGGDTSGFTSDNVGASIRVSDNFSGLVVMLEDVVVGDAIGTSAVQSVTTLRISECTFEENQTGAALHLATFGTSKSFGAGTETRIERSIFRENDGFAINAVKNQNNAHQFLLANSTVTGNDRTTSLSYGAAIFTTNSARILNSTIADDGRYGVGAITDAFGTPVVEIQSSVFSSNDSGSVLPVGATDGVALPTSRGGNVVSDAGAGVFTEPTDQASTNPQLQLLADNGGPTLTHLLAPGSPAIDAGLDSGTLGSCPATDQRGEPRPQDGDGNGSAICDAGAVEVAPEPGALALGAAALLALAGVARRQR
jgi:CSLREA domain-containing protein